MMCYACHFAPIMRSQKEDGRDYSFEVFCDLLIRDQKKLLDEGKVGGKHWAHFLKGKYKYIYKDRICINVSSPR